MIIIIVYFKNRMYNLININVITFGNIWTHVLNTSEKKKSEYI